jgi:hypothetical protein
MIFSASLAGIFTGYCLYRYHHGHAYTCDFGDDSDHTHDHRENGCPPQEDKIPDNEYLHTTMQNPTAEDILCKTTVDTSSGYSSDESEWFFES